MWLHPCHVSKRQVGLLLSDIGNVASHSDAAVRGVTEVVVCTTDEGPSEPEQQSKLKKVTAGTVRDATGEVSEGAHSASGNKYSLNRSNERM